MVALPILFYTSYVLWDRSMFFFSLFFSLSWFLFFFLFVFIFYCFGYDVFWSNAYGTAYGNQRTLKKLRRPGENEENQD